MTTHREIRTVQYTAKQMYELVSDVREYPEFLPWCQALRVKEYNIQDGEGHLVADMVVRYKIFFERFRSLVKLKPEEKTIEVEYISGPFKSLSNVWKFHDLEEGGSKIEFLIDFEFKNKLLQTVALEVFDKAFSKMSGAFIKQADVLYAA